jgi:hypothetical protein
VTRKTEGNLSIGKVLPTQGFSHLVWAVDSARLAFVTFFLLSSRVLVEELNMLIVAF